MPEHLAEGVHVFAAGRRLYDARLCQAGVGPTGHERGPLALDLLPPTPHLCQGMQVVALCNGGIRPSQPAMQPQLLGPDDMSECTVDAAEAALQVAEVLLVRQLSHRSEHDAMRPGVVLEQLEE